MLEVLRHQQLEGVLATVVRYFGGVKLGAGGLVRAYTDAVAKTLIDAPLQPLVAQRMLACSIPYDAEGTVRREIAVESATLDEVRHESLVHLVFSLPAHRADILMRRIQDATQGRVVWHRVPA
jgi:putative IMPACT (imprinted ancient) family translation regulator